MTDKLKPCPGCGSTNIQFMESGGDGAWGYYVCMESDCGWSSPDGVISLGEAEYLWNKRFKEDSDEEKSQDNHH